MVINDTSMVIFIHKYPTYIHTYISFSHCCKYYFIGQFIFLYRYNMQNTATNCTQTFIINNQSIYDTATTVYICMQIYKIIANLFNPCLSPSLEAKCKQEKFHNLYVVNQNAIQLIKNFYQTLKNGPYSNSEAVKFSVSPKSHVCKLEVVQIVKLYFTE